MLTSRITATSNAIFTVENMFVWNVATAVRRHDCGNHSIGTVSLPMAGALIVIAGGMVIAMFRLAAGRQAAARRFRRQGGRCRWRDD